MPPAIRTDPQDGGIEAVFQEDEDSMKEMLIQQPDVKSVATDEKIVQTLTRAEVLSVANPTSRLLIIIGSGVYDVTEWQKSHPGGMLTIQALCGKDATDCFHSMHPRPIRQSLLDRFLYANLSDEDKGRDERTDDFRNLTDQMRQAGLFETDYTFYYKKAVGLAILFSTVLAGVLLSNSFWVHCLAGVLLGTFFQQIAFIGHDMGHNSVTKDPRREKKLSLFVGNFCSGISGDWWKRGHNVHHIVTNSVHWDPDIQHLPVFAVSPRFLREKIFSPWYNWELDLSPLTHILVRYQHVLYYPIMAFARFNLYVQSLLHALNLGAYSDRQKDKVDSMWPALSLFGFWTWLILLTAQLPTLQSMVAFIIISHNVAGVLHVQITLSHFAMDSYGGVTYDDSDNGFLVTQLKGTLDIDCPVWMDWFHGGLQFQTVHHLWPCLPRHNLRRAQTILKSFCAKHGLVYHRADFWEANCMVLRTLRKTGETTKTLSELFADGWNLSG